MVTSAEFCSLLEDPPRNDFRVKSPPGAFADTVKDDHDATIACLRGAAGERRRGGSITTTALRV